MESIGAAKVRMPVRIVGGRRSVGCKATATVHFSPYSCPITTAMGLQIREKLSSPKVAFRFDGFCRRRA